MTTRSAHFLVCGVAMLAWLGIGACRCAAVFPYVAAAAAAAPAVPAAAQVAKDVVAIPISALNIARLPLGAAEVVLSPLPGLTMASGFGNMGRGLVAPFKLIGSVLDLPFSAVGTLLSAFSRTPPSAYAVDAAPPESGRS